MDNSFPESQTIIALDDGKTKYAPTFTAKRMRAVATKYEDVSDWLLV